MKQEALQRIGGVAAFCQAVGLATLVLLFFLVLPGLGYGLADLAEPTSAFQFVTAQPLLFFWMTAVAGIFIDAFTFVLVFALHDRLQAGSPGLVNVSTAFGFLSLFLFMVAALLNYGAVRELASTYQSSQAGAEAAYLALNAAINSLRGGANFAAGLWFLLLSWAALRTGGLPRSLSYFGLLVGVLNLFELFGVPLSLLVNIPWFLALGFVLLRNQAARRSPPATQASTT